MKHSKPLICDKNKGYGFPVLKSFRAKEGLYSPHVTRALNFKVLPEDIGGMNFHLQIETYRRKAQESFRVNEFNLQGYAII